MLDDQRRTDQSADGWILGQHPKPPVELGMAGRGRAVAEPDTAKPGQPTVRLHRHGRVGLGQPDHRDDEVARRPVRLVRSLRTGSILMWL